MDEGLTGRKDRALAKQLAERKAAMSQEELAQIVKETKELKEYQETPSLKEDLEKIPLLTRADMKKEAAPYYNEEKKVGDTTLLYHNIYTNGIG